MKQYSVWLHWKQGDEMADCLESTKTVSEALIKKAQMAQFVSDQCTDLAKLFDGKNIECYADTHHIGFSGDEEILNQAVEMDLLSIDEFENEEEFDEDFEETDDWNCDDGK